MRGHKETVLAGVAMKTLSRWAILPALLPYSALSLFFFFFRKHKKTSCAFPPPWTRYSVWLLFLYGALDSHPFFPSHVASGRCILSAACSCWCRFRARGAQLLVCRGCVDVAGAICALAVPSSWRTAVVLVVAGVV